MRAGMTGVAERRGRGGRRRGGKRLAWPRPRTRSRRRPRSAQPATRRAEEHDRTRRARALLRAGPTSSDSSLKIVQHVPLLAAQQHRHPRDLQRELRVLVPSAHSPLRRRRAGRRRSCGSARSRAATARARAFRRACLARARGRSLARPSRRSWRRGRRVGSGLPCPCRVGALAAAARRQRRQRARPARRRLRGRRRPLTHWL